ncbi:MAG: leucyl aminopeptidase [Rhodoglobus sp.]
MTVPSLALSSHSLATIEADVLVLGVHKTQKGPKILGDDLLWESLATSLDTLGVTGGRDEVFRVPAPGLAAGSIALVGLGSEPVSHNTLRYAAGTAARQLRGVDTLLFAFPAEEDDHVLAVLEGAALGAYSYTRYRSVSLTSTPRSAQRVILATKNSHSSLVKRAEIIATAVSTVRDLVNSPPNDLYPESFAEIVRTAAVAKDLTVEVFAEEELLAGGFGGILGVGQGSARGPRLVKVSYCPTNAAQHLALVGKGITFDSGGLSLKPPASMIGMKYDMTGAATVLAVTLAAAQLGLGVRITAWLCLAENLPSGAAMRPNDVITIRGGNTVEVLNTDAEGRLVLADGLVAASEEHPDAIIDVATLTGAASIALGTRYVGAMGDEKLVGRLVSAGDRVGETLWHMPIPSELRPLLASDIADIANVKPGTTAGAMMIAAAFLQEFIGTSRQGDESHTIPWAHLDIAGAANNSGTGWGFTGKGPTGVCVRALIELAENFS